MIKIDIAWSELIRLKNGEPPSSINKNWDCEMVITALASSLSFIEHPVFNQLNKMNSGLIQQREDGDI